MLNRHQLKKLSLLSKLIEQTITYKCMNSPAWNEETNMYLSLVDYNGEKMKKENPRIMTKVTENECNVSITLRNGSKISIKPPPPMTEIIFKTR
jgi:hypothetical protein